MGIAATTDGRQGKTLTWRGRATRSECWWFHLTGIAGAGVAAWLLLPAFQPSLDALRAGDRALALTLVPALSDPGLLACWIGSIGLVFSQWALLVRRLHDVNLRGWWSLMAFVPLVGAVGLLLLALAPSYREANRWGPPPGAPPAPTAAPARPAPIRRTAKSRDGKRAVMSIDDLRAMRHARMPSPSQAAYVAVPT